MKYALLFLSIVSMAFAANYHGCTLAPDNQHGWIACLDTVLILHTSNGGVSWESQDAPLGSLTFFDVTCVDELNAWTCGIEGEILHTKDGGLNWYQQYTGLAKYATRIEFIDHTYGWAAAGDGFVGVTTDGGEVWEQIVTSFYGAEFYGIWFVDQLEGWIVAGWPDSIDTGQGIIARSTDGGLHWDTLYISHSYEDFFDVYFFDQLNGIVVGGDEIDYSPIILKTTDGGLTLNPITAPPNSYYLRAVDFVGNEGWAVGRFGTIIHSTDGGNTWTFQNSPATLTLFDVDFSDNLHGLACGYDMILRTTDGGQNWQYVGVQENHDSKPKITTLDIYPNPFRKMTNISFSTGHSAKGIELKIYDCMGRLVKQFLLPTSYSLLPTIATWDGTDDDGGVLPSGIYFAQLITPEHQITEKIILLR
ncbi:MAG: T9SS type A sorting domain-containing protein [candidate division WOR-3 bacterium]|nr:MAG: T9SS type A sorting domain-containing protein [candidate division WOR-3 bacterium]